MSLIKQSHLHNGDHDGSLSIFVQSIWICASWYKELSQSTRHISKGHLENRGWRPVQYRILTKEKKWETTFEIRKWAKKLPRHHFWESFNKCKRNWNKELKLSVKCLCVKSWNCPLFELATVWFFQVFFSFFFFHLFLLWVLKSYKNRASSSMLVP